MVGQGARAWNECPASLSGAEEREDVEEEDARQVRQLQPRLPHWSQILDHFALRREARLHDGGLALRRHALRGAGRRLLLVPGMIPGHVAEQHQQGSLALGVPLHLAQPRSPFLPPRLIFVVPELERYSYDVPGLEQALKDAGKLARRHTRCSESADRVRCQDAVARSNCQAHMEPMRVSKKEEGRSHSVCRSLELQSLGLIPILLPMFWPTMLLKACAPLDKAGAACARVYAWLITSHKVWRCMQSRVNRSANALLSH
mmetsp:Transcript_38913/g.112400  ORF Transcript_38913/g.112400 Transcript_38913/m.112400 type:complete len:259 (+) Transcript_38913:256-1032(+)